MSPGVDWMRDFIMAAIIVLCCAVASAAGVHVGVDSEQGVMLGSSWRGENVAWGEVDV
jgi:hypothetical protein